MPVTGRKPKPQGQAITRHAQTHEWIEVERVPFEDGPKLPRLRSCGRAWPKRTRQKWESWRTMPHARLWGSAEWDFAFDSIELAALVHDGDTKWSTELRNRERVLGTTIDFRRDIRIRYVDPVENEESAEVTKIADYRNL